MFDESLKYFWARIFLRGFLVVTLTVALAGPVPAELYALTAKWYRALPFKLVIFVDVWFPIVRIFRAFSSLSSCLQYLTWDNTKEDLGCHTYWGYLQCDFFFSYKILMTVLIFYIASHKQSLQNQDLCVHWEITGNKKKAPSLFWASEWDGKLLQPLLLFLPPWPPPRFEAKWSWVYQKSKLNLPTTLYILRPACVWTEVSVIQKGGSSQQNAQCLHPCSSRSHCLLKQMSLHGTRGLFSICVCVERSHWGVQTLTQNQGTHLLLTSYPCIRPLFFSIGEAQKTSMSVAERLLAKMLAGGLVGSADECGKIYNSISYIQIRFWILAS